jgi:hypothetical protein
MVGFDLLSEVVNDWNKSKKIKYCNCGNVERFVTVFPNGFYCHNCGGKLRKKDYKIKFVDND